MGASCLKKNNMIVPPLPFLTIQLCQIDAVQVNQIRQLRRQTCLNSNHMKASHRIQHFINCTLIWCFVIATRIACKPKTVHLQNAKPHDAINQQATNRQTILLCFAIHLHMPSCVAQYTSFEVSTNILHAHIYNIYLFPIATQAVLGHVINASFTSVPATVKAMLRAHRRKT